MPKGEHEREQTHRNRTVLVATHPCKITSLSEEVRQRGRLYHIPVAGSMDCRPPRPFGHPVVISLNASHLRR